MYNLFKHQQQKANQQNLQHLQHKYQKWAAKHQQFKKKASQSKQRYQKFIQEQTQSPMVFEDDHYKIWRYNKQFRDIQNQSHFKGFKSFVHKPNQQINKFFNERQRKQIVFNSSKAQNLVDSKLIPQELRSRSLRSQGPLNPKLTFRPIVSGQSYLQPRLRYSNITDKQRMLQNSVTFDDKFKEVYNSFSMTKSQIGQTKVSSIPKQQLRNRLDQIELTNSKYDYSKAFQYNVDNEENSVDKQSNKIKQFSIKQSTNRKDYSKTYFKLAQTLALKGNEKSKQLLISTQYCRKKDLSNINRNISCEAYIKPPII